MSKIRILLVGAPNVGKTTLFNFLTGEKQRITNMSGTTVGLASGKFQLPNGKTAEIIDTPGIYSIYNDHNKSITDSLVINLLTKEKYDLIINVVSSDNLSNNLILTTNLLDLGIPTIVLINKTTNDLHLDLKSLEVTLGCQVMALNCNDLINTSKKKSWWHKQSQTQDTSNDINELIKIIPYNLNYVPAPKIFYGVQVETQLRTTLDVTARYEIVFNSYKSLKLNEQVTKFVKRIVNVACKNVNNLKKKNLSDKLDVIFLNKILGLPIFLLVMYIFFFVVINVSKIFQDFFGNIAQVFFITLPTAFFQNLHIDNIFSNMVISLGSSMQVIATFIPIMFIFYICLDFLENSGYMSRGAYLTDSIMRFFGLPGKSLVTMLIGFGCNVPAVLATRTVSNKTERILTIVASPFVACSARLTVYVLFVAIFFPKSNGVNIIYLLFLLGIVVGVLTVWLFKNTLLRNKESFFVLELPRYRLPKITTLIFGSAHRVHNFLIKRVGKLIIPLMLVFYLLHYTFTHSSTLRDNMVVKSLYNSQVIFAPMGLTKDNWPATVSLIGGTIAKETVVTTLQSL